MAGTLIGVTLDCVDLETAVSFWRQALGYAERPEHSVDGTFRTLFAPRHAPGLHHVTIQQVPERKTVKNRAHLDLFVDDVDAEVERLVGLGAGILRDEELEDDVFRTIVMADPEGNEFCLVQKPDR